MANGLDDAIVSDRPDIKRRPRFTGGKVMKAVDLAWLALDADHLASRYMPFYPAQSNPKTLLNHLHAAADAQHRKPAPLCPIEQGKFHGVTFRGIAPARRKVIPAGQHQSANGRSRAQLRRYFEYIRKCYRSQPARRQEAWPSLVETVTALAIFRYDLYPLGNGYERHTAFCPFGAGRTEFYCLTFCAK